MGREVEQRFTDLLDNYGREKFQPLLEYIAQFRVDGRDKLFRAGTSLSTLLISRSVDGGLREDQKYISKEALDIDNYEVKFREPLKTYREYRISDLNDPKLSKLLATLQDTLVD